MRNPACYIEILAILRSSTQGNGFPSRNSSEIMGSPNPKLRICLLFVVLAFILATTLFSPVGDEFLRSHKSTVPRKVFDDSNDQKRFESLATKLVNVRAVTSNGSTNGSTNASSCGFAGNSDIYGLGIRLGVYLQWIATFVSYQLLEDSIDSVFTANWVFLFATMIATLVITASRSSYNTYSAEVIIMLYIIVGEIVVCVLPIIAEGNSLPSLLGVYGSFSAFFAVFLFASWFWFKGVWLMSPTPCGTYFSLLSEGAVTNSSQIAIPRAITTIFAVFWGVICVLGTWSILGRIHEVYVKGKESSRSQHHSTSKALSGIVMRTVFELSRPIETRKKRHFFLDKGKKWKSNFRYDLKYMQ